MCVIAFLSNRLLYGRPSPSPVLTTELRRRARRTVFAVLICWAIASVEALSFAGAWLNALLTPVMLAILAWCGWEFGRGLL
jgi:hypothetical protein